MASLKSEDWLGLLSGIGVSIMDTFIPNSSVKNVVTGVVDAVVKSNDEKIDNDLFKQTVEIMAGSEGNTVSEDKVRYINLIVDMSDDDFLEYKSKLIGKIEKLQVV